MKKIVASLTLICSLFILASCKPNEPDETESYHYQPSITFDESGLITDTETEA